MKSLDIEARNRQEAPKIPDLSRPKPKSAKKRKARTSYEINDLYRESRLAFGKTKKKMIDQDHKVISRILDLIGFTDLEEIDRESAEQVRDALAYFPKNANKYDEFRSLKGYEIIHKNMALSTPKPTISNRTIKGSIEKFSTFMNWAKAHGYVTENVFFKLPTYPPNYEDQRYALEDEHLRRVFSMEDYIKHKYMHPYYYWIPLLLRYTGARLNELCQLSSSDIAIVDHVPCIIIRDNGEDKSTKNSSSNRTVPIHSDLINKGFLNFVVSCRNKKLFEELPLVNGYYSHNVSKWFARRRAKMGLGKGYDAHSFRHTFINELKQLQTPKEIIEALVGHEHKSQSLDLYGKKYNPNILSPVIERVSATHSKMVRHYL
ncbi:site-specific integrase [Vibrio pelagius]|uniref:Site-specific integrase n=1 Tax=Vibrio pelagius TaxID=28169 RepID=A0ABY5G5I5_VIBPE|nr:site-specific integrase [Vibrio pelagius]UTT85413.1 site-specific integrase [Vibrio pelagius]